MTRWSFAWAAFLAVVVVAGAVLEFVAIRRGGYWASLTGQIERVMLLHPVAAVVVLAGVGAVGVAFLAHLTIDYLTITLRP